MSGFFYHKGTQRMLKGAQRIKNVIHGFVFSLVILCENLCVPLWLIELG